MRRLAIAAAVGTAVVGTAIPSLAAQTSPSSPTQQSPVGVTVSTDGGVFVGTTIFGQPGLSAAVANGRACVGFSLEVPFCADLPGIAENIPGDITVGPAHAHVDTSNGVGVSTGLNDQPLVSASVANGWACVGFSYEIPFCYPLNQNGFRPSL